MDVRKLSPEEMEKGCGGNTLPLYKFEVENYIRLLFEYPGINERALASDLTDEDYDAILACFASVDKFVAVCAFAHNCSTAELISAINRP